MILGVDPGFARIGYAVLDECCASVVSAGVVKTKGPPGKIDKTTADLERLAEIIMVFRELIGEWKPRLVVLEQMPRVRSSAVARNCAAAWGAIAGIAAALDVEFLSLDAQRVKKTLVGNASASKERVKEHVEALAGFSEWPKGNDAFHATDAAAVVYAALKEGLIDP